MQLINNELEKQNDVQNLYGSIAGLISKAKIKVAVTANAEITLLYWKVCRAINEFVLQGKGAS